MTHGAIEISVCIATFRRPGLLVDTLSSIGRLILPEGVRLQVVVIDNDKLETAKPVVDAFAKRSAFPVIYDVEQNQNIALARNRSVLHATGEYVAFIDDDEVADPMWLQSLLETAKKFGAQAVLGPVLPLLGSDAPTWVRNGGFFDRQRFSTGTRRSHGGTGNALVLRSLLGPGKLQFDARFGLSGGSDTLLFWQLVQAGAAIVWCDEAIVAEAVPGERTTVRWILRRAYRGGQTYARIFVSPLPLPMRILSTVKRLALLLIAAVSLPICACLGKRWIVRCLKKVASNAGQLSCGVAARFEEYRAS